MAAAASAKKTTAKTNTSAVSNPAGQKKYYVGGGNSNKGKAKPKKKNTALATTTAKKPAAKKNPGGGGAFKINGGRGSAAMFAIGGAVALRTFDMAVNKFAPEISAPIRIGASIGLGYAVGTYGTRYLGSFAGIAEAALYLKAALDAYDAYLKPTVNGYLGITDGLAVVAQQPVQNTQTGQLGMRLFLNDGNAVDVFGNDEAQPY